MPPFTVAIVGRPNVGKSTLFNRLVGKRLALVDDTPGVTRDRREGEARLGDLRFTVIDTAGLEEAEPASLEGRMRVQTEAAVTDADLVLFLIDARAGLTPLDRHFADLLRRSGKPVVLVANKAEGRAGEAGTYEAFALGLGDPVALSAEHGEGLADLYEAIVAHAPEEGEAEAAPEGEAGPLKVAIVGRPNAGKSTLINRLIGRERLLTGPEAGITRDSIAIDWSFRGTPVRLFDTAGIRRKARVQEKLEKLSVADALRAIRFAEVVVLLVDAGAPFEKQDLQIADLVVREGRALVIGINKWDLVAEPDQFRRTLEAEIERLLPQVRGVTLVPVSALSGKGLDRLMQAVIKARDLWSTRIPTGRLNRWFATLVESHPPPAVAGRRLKLRYLTQAKTRPPTFVLFCSRPGALPEAYKRYVANGIRTTFGLQGVPIRIVVRGGDNPFAPD